MRMRQWMEMGRVTAVAAEAVLLGREDGGLAGKTVAGALVWRYCCGWCGERGKGKGTAGAGM